ncbi:MCE family protein [Nocardioides sp.]|uniref:MCE family protein n=1 Tax=Nocardioides sp. TaxID=35761 RepID=UPI0039E4AF35
MKRLATLLSLLVGLAVIVFGGRFLASGWVYNAPLPGGADLGSHPVTLTADFADVLDLVPQSSVKVDNVAVGRVTAIDLNADGHSARVKLKVNGSVSLPVGTTARLQQTSLLGEKYVALVRPAGTTSTAARLADGAEIGMADTSAAAEVEQVLGALSTVLNGGGIGQFQEISQELQAISADRPDEIRNFLEQLNHFTTTLNDRRDSITSALDGLAALSERLDGDKEKIATALDGLSPGMQVLVDQREQLVAMLGSLDKLSDVTVKTLDASQKDIVADLRLLRPILTQLAKAGDDLPNALQILLTYPFPDSVLGAVKGDYLNVFVTTNFRTLPTGCSEGGCAWPQVGGGSADATSSARSAPSRRGLTKVASPTLLPSTSSPVAGATSSSVSVPSILSSAAAESTDSAAPTTSTTESTPPDTDPSVESTPSGEASVSGSAAADPSPTAQRAKEEKR